MSQYKSVAQRLAENAMTSALPEVVAPQLKRKTTYFLDANMLRELLRREHPGEVPEDAHVVINLTDIGDSYTFDGSCEIEISWYEV